LKRPSLLQSQSQQPIDAEAVARPPQWLDSHCVNDEESWVKGDSGGVVVGEVGAKKTYKVQKQNLYGLSIDGIVISMEGFLRGWSTRDQAAWRHPSRPTKPSPTCRRPYSLVRFTRRPELPEYRFSQWDLIDDHPMVVSSSHGKLIDYPSFSFSWWFSFLYRFSFLSVISFHPVCLNSLWEISSFSWVIFLLVTFSFLVESSSLGDFHLVLGRISFILLLSKSHHCFILLLSKSHQSHHCLTWSCLVVNIYAITQSIRFAYYLESTLYCTTV
jgi:hypothetical protein